ncbi:hypothetical protein ACQWU4_00215 [Chryseobacterium sp. MIQD13]|uniref:hypothetical protein n=1 Tax=Chryseobacterium sp. MIQD13 TaxID=3422310 RepID=UPI003D2C1B59
MKSLTFLFFLCCFSYAAAQKQYSLELNFLTDSNEQASDVQVTFIKETQDDAVIINKVNTDKKGVLKLKLTDDYFDKNGSLIIQAYYHNQKAYYLDYYEKVSKKQFPFKKTVILEHIVPPTLEEINSMNPPPPPPPRAN